MPLARQSMSIVSRLSSKVRIWANPDNSDAYFAIDFSLWQALELKQYHRTIAEKAAS